MSILIGKNYNARLSSYQKNKNGKRNMKEKAELLDMYYGNFRDYEHIDKLKINYDLLNGRLDVSLYDDPLYFKIGDEEILLDYQNVSHYPLTMQVANAIIGEQESRPFRPMIKDNTPHRRTFIQDELNRRIENFLMQEMEQRKQKILMSIANSSGVDNIYSMSPEQQMQVKQQIDAQVQAETPEEILEYLKFDYQTPTAKQAQRMIDFLVEYKDIKWKDVEGFKHAVVAGEEYYYCGERNGDLVYEVVHPMFFQWGGSFNTEWVQDATWAKRETWLTVEDAQQRHAMHLSEKDLRELEYHSEPLGGMRNFYDWDRNEAMKKVMYTYSMDEGLQQKYAGANIRTKEGERRMIDMYSDIFSKDNTDIFGLKHSFGVREAHIVWRDKVMLKLVKRIIDDKVETFWVSEHYEPRPEDYEVKKVWVDELWEDTILGSFDYKHVNTRPIPNQYKSLDCPFNVPLPYYGRRYNTHGNVSKNVSLIDVGKTLQKDFDVTMASLKHDMATNYGQVFIWGMNLKPDGMPWQDWMDSMRNGGLMLADGSKRGLNQFDYQMMKNVNISKMSDIQAKVQLLEFFRQTHARSMFFNDARMGDIGQYATGVNTQVNKVASYNQTARFFETHRKIKEKSLTGLLNIARHYYKREENFKRAATFLDDVALAELKTAPYTAYQDMGITLSNSSSELEKLTLLKQQALTLIQNGTRPEAVLELVLADTEGEVRDIIKRESRSSEEMRQQAMQAQAQQAQAERDSKMAIEKMKQDREDARDMAKLQSQERRTAIDVTKFALAQDINKNNQSDLVDKTLLQVEADMAKQSQKLDADMTKHSQELDADMAKHKAEMEMRKEELKAKLRADRTRKK